MKIKENLPAILLIAFIIRLLIFGVGISDSIALAALCGFNAYGWFFFKPKTSLSDEILARIAALEDQLKQTKDKVNSFHFGSHLKK